MATCHSCGSEMNGMYCNTCGARASEERGSGKTHKKDTATPKASRTPAPSRGPGLLSPQRIGRTTAMALLGVALFGGGMITGFWMASPTSAGSTPVTSTTVVAEDGSTVSLPPVAVAGKLMDEGVELMSKGERTAAVSKFRQAIEQYEAVVKAEPTNLYARSYLGLTYYYAGDSKKALDLTQGVLKDDPNYLWAIFNLAWIYETAEKPGEAKMMYEKYLAVAPTEKANQIKYAEQFELIDRQIQAATEAVARLGGGAKQ